MKEHNRLKAECARLRRDVEELREAMYQQSHDLRIQFERIAQIQAVLDEEHLAEAGVLPHKPRR